MPTPTTQTYSQTHTTIPPPTRTHIHTHVHTHTHAHTHSQHPANILRKSLESPRHESMCKATPMGVASKKCVKQVWHMYAKSYICTKSRNHRALLQKRPAKETCNFEATPMGVASKKCVKQVLHMYAKSYICTKSRNHRSLLQKSLLQKRKSLESPRH